MNALTQVTDYLRTKIGKVNLNNQKANTGGVLIKTHKGWEEKVDRVIMLTFQALQSQFSKQHNAGEKIGECKLTIVSMAIGKLVAPVIQREPLKNKRDQLALGDVLIEGFVYHGFVGIERPLSLNESYTLRASPKWAELAEVPAELYRYAVLHSAIEPSEYPTNEIHKNHPELFNEDAAYVRALHKLQQVRWKINSPVLDAVLAHKDKFIPKYELMDSAEKKQWYASKIVEWEFVTNKAICIEKWDGYYQTMDLDYRGRMYNEESFLNYQGADLGKGMKLFYTEKPITDRGEFWLAVHTAATYNQSYSIDEIPEWCEEDYRAHLLVEKLDNISVDKMTLRDRAQWTYQHADDIMQWASDSEFQMKAEKPVTFLACCFEWQRVEETGMTCLPVAIDGSNNGWQHLGAISKDKHTGNLVGLVPIDIQNDFYVQTAKELIALTTDERIKGILESMPMKHIRKGISKRGSMTRAYSAGSGKISDNMFFDCRQADYDKKYGITKADCRKLARTLVKAIQNVCPGPLQTMEYLQKLAEYMLGRYEVQGPGTPADYKELHARRYVLICAKELSEEELKELQEISIKLKEYHYELAWGEGRDHISWETPSGFKAKYEKFTMEKLKVRARLNGKQIKHVLQSPTDRPDLKGFMCGISPNYIHSLDASHMALVIEQWDHDFGAVHDSFSTHASDVDDLLSKTKQVFIDMYDTDNYFDIIRKNLTNNEDDIEQPTLGKLDIKEVTNSDYFFA